MSKIQLKEQAKSLLLRGCYKMAYNKFNRLMELGSQGFSQRQWSIIHLNHAICLQFLQRQEEALISIKKSIQIDASYQKAYFRKLQILQGLQRYEEAIESVPSWIQNIQIISLMQKIKQQYFNSLGLDQIITNLSSGDKPIEYVKQSYNKFYQRVVDAISAGNLANQAIQNISIKISNYYKLLMQNKKYLEMSYYLQTIHRLFILQKLQQAAKVILKNLMKQFWKQFYQHSILMHQKQGIQSQVQINQLNILKYSDLNLKVLTFVNTLIEKNIFQSNRFETIVQLLNNSLVEQNQTSCEAVIRKIIQKIIIQIEKEPMTSKLKLIKKLIIILDILIKIHLEINQKLQFQQITTQVVYYLRYYYNNILQQNKNPFNLKSEQISSFLGQNLDNFAIVYVYEQFIHKIDKNSLSQTTTRLSEQLQKRSISQKRQYNSAQQIVNQRQLMLMYISILLKINIKYEWKIDLKDLLNRQKHYSKLNDDPLSQIFINVLLLLAINNKKHVIQLLEHFQITTNIIKTYLNNQYIQQITNTNLVVNFIYIITVNFQEEQTQSYAKQMGVTVQQIKKAKKIQGQKEDTQFNQKMANRRLQYKQRILKQWMDIIPRICDLLLKIRQDSCLLKWAKLLIELAQIDHSRFHHPKIIEMMIYSFKIEKNKVGRFFCILCKKINVELIKYEFLQSITDILLYNVQNGQHELLIFESLLGLINLTSNLTNKIIVPLKSLLNCFFQQNNYIIHAACQLANNVLVYYEKQDIDEFKQFKDIIPKYIGHFRQIIQEKNEINLTDYSHPSRIYSTLLSLAIVMDIDQLEQFSNWKQMEKNLLHIETSRAITLFKCVIYMKMKERLKGNWWHHFQKDLHELKAIDFGKWQKLKQWMK